MLQTVPLPDLPRGTRLMGGWTVGSTLPRLDETLLRAVAERADGRRAVLEAGLFQGERLVHWLDEFVEDIELWADTRAFLPVLAAGRVEGSQVVVRIVAAPRGRVLTSLAKPASGRPPSMEVAVHAAASLGQAIATAHARGLVHGALHPGRVHLLANGVEIEPGGFELALRQARGDGVPSRADDVKAVAELLLVMLGAPSGALPPSLPEPLRVVLSACLDTDPFERPDAPDLVAALRQVAEGLTPGAVSDRSTPVTVNRTVAPRLGVVDVTLPPAPPPAPEVRSLVPVGSRESVPRPHLAKVEKRRRTVEYAIGIVVLLIVVYVGWSFLA
jgi:hypothetical protein